MYSLLFMNDLSPGCLFPVVIIQWRFVIDVNVCWVYLAPPNIPSATVLRPQYPSAGNRNKISQPFHRESAARTCIMLRWRLKGLDPSGGQTEIVLNTWNGPVEVRSIFLKKYLKKLISWVIVWLKWTGAYCVVIFHVFALPWAGGNVTYTTSIGSIDHSSTR